MYIVAVCTQVIDYLLYDTKRKYILNTKNKKTNVRIKTYVTYPVCV